MHSRLDNISAVTILPLAKWINQMHVILLYRASPTKFNLGTDRIFFIELITNIFAYYLLNFFSSPIKSKEKLPLKFLFFISIHPNKFQ